jgi:6-phosphogluconolactonase
MSAVTTPFDVHEAADAMEHAALGAELLGRAIYEAIAVRGVARVALSGGTTPGPVYRRLAEMALPFERVEWFWVDERAAPKDSTRSNYRSAREDLGVDRFAAARVHRMEADDPDLEAAARRYESLLRRTFGIASAVAFDAVTLGVGDDGHTASLFPGTGAAAIDDRLVAAIPAQPARGLEARLSLTAPVIQEARLVVVLARGATKRAPIAAAWLDGPADEVPARIVQKARGKVAWILDREARPSG